MTIEAGTASDLPQVRHLLEQHRLLLDGIDDHVGTLLVARDGAHVAGTAALEVYAEGALLRSVAVESARQGHNLGHRLTESALQLARALGIREVFLLTTTAERFFARFGFEPIARTDVPASVLRSVEFGSACCASAVVMRKRLPPER